MTISQRLLDAVQKIRELRAQIEDQPFAMFATEAAWQELKRQCPEAKVEESVAFKALAGLPVSICQYPELDGPRESIKRERDVLIATIQDGKLSIKQMNYKALNKFALTDFS